MSKLSDETGDLLILTAPGFNLEQYTLGDKIPMETLQDVFGQVGKNWFWSASDPDEDRRRAEELLDRIGKDMGIQVAA